MRIITNTASLFRPSEGTELGIEVIPESVSLDGKALRDYIDIETDEFVNRIRSGEMATTSQPAVGEVLNLLEGNDEETILLTVADGLSGEYMTAMGVRNTLANKDKIHVFNSGSLGGALRYMVKKASVLRSQGLSTGEILSQLKACGSSSRSYVIPADFQFLRRSGRISNLTSRLGTALNLIPVLTQTEDRHRISLMSIKRTWKAALDTVRKSMQEHGVDENYLISVSYADKKEAAERILTQIRESFPKTENELLQLSPSLITHGGPGCIVIQAIRK